MKLLVFKVESYEGQPDGYGALTFEQSGKLIADIYKIMKDNNVQAFADWNEDTERGYEVTLKHTISIQYPDQAVAIVQLLGDLTDDDWIGDYDKRKHTDWVSHVVHD